MAESVESGSTDPTRAEIEVARPYKSEKLTPATGILTGPTPVRAFEATRVAPPQIADQRSPLADKLNAPNGTAQQDVAIVGDVLDAYFTIFRRLPVGTNAEITAALAGDNVQGLAPIPADHPAINEHGELVDRWGTRFFFHQVSSNLMEVQSAGPDGRHFTDDDISWPESKDIDPALVARFKP